MSSKNILDLEALITSEISDFFSGFDNPGEPATAAKANRILLSRVRGCFQEFLATKTAAYTAARISEEDLRGLRRPCHIIISQPSGVYMSYEEYRQNTIFSRTKPVNLDYLAQHALEHLEQSKRAMTDAFDKGDDETGQFFREDAIEFVQLIRVLNRGIRKQGGL